MKLKAITLFTLTSLITLQYSCQEKKVLQEVEIPDAIIFKREKKSAFPNPKTIKTNSGPFQMEGLKFQYEDFKDFLEPENIYLHYAKHHLAYANNLNRTLINTPLEKRSIEIILSSTDAEHPLLKSYSGGYYNHNIYWKSICQETDSKPSDELLALIIRDFGSVQALKDKFSLLANQQIGSGWVWLLFSSDKMMLLSTPNEDNPLMPPYNISGVPLLAIDLWEHAYYPTYKNDRKEYIDRFIEHINWTEMSRIVAPPIVAVETDSIKITPKVITPRKKAKTIAPVTVEIPE